MTGNHPIWSEDRHDYIAAMDLRVGERLKNLSGDTVYVQQKLPRPGPTPVYNLEVQDEHVYYVGTNGVLAHNAGKDNAGDFCESSGNGKPPIQGPIRSYNEARKARVPGYDDHHLDPPLGREDPSYPTGPTIGVRNDNSGGIVPGGVNLHTAKGGFQTALNYHIKKDLGLTIKQWNNLPDEKRRLHLRRYYASLGIPFPN
ncbi:MAG: hypothetical protein JNK57_17235 [Planctomycetaceae bacterium]|nr:hypothetical protein [Planctomycetaceae bacterium]